MGWGKSELKKTGENMKESRIVGEGVMRSTSRIHLARYFIPGSCSFIKSKPVLLYSVTLITSTWGVCR